MLIINAVAFFEITLIVSPITDGVTTIYEGVFPSVWGIEKYDGALQIKYPNSTYEA